jgi:lysine-specific histone demethylase 1
MHCFWPIQIEELLASDSRRTQLLRVLRLLCLQSTTSGGIRAARYDAIRRSVAHTYGYQHLYTMSNLEKAGACFCCVFCCCSGIA